MGRLRLDLMISEVLSNLSNSMIQHFPALYHFRFYLCNSILLLQGTLFWDGQFTPPAFLTPSLRGEFSQLTICIFRDPRDFVNPGMLILAFKLHKINSQGGKQIWVCLIASLCCAALPWQPLHPQLLASGAHRTVLPMGRKNSTRTIHVKMCSVLDKKESILPFSA